ncbi:MAG: hypothetical protein ACLFNR_00005, partial [Candidatus Paceibacterota bacterium]
AADDEDLDATYEIGPDDNDGKGAIRGVDTAGIQNYANAAKRSFDLTEEEEGKLDVSRNDNTPEEGLVLTEADEFEEVHLLSFDLEVEDDDIDLEALTVALDGLDTFEGAVQDILLKEGSSVLGAESVDSSSTSTEFEDLDLELAEDEVVELDVYADVKVTDVNEQSATNTLTASVNADDNKRIGYDMADNPINLDGDADGYAQSVFVTAPNAELVDSSIVRSGDDQEYGEATLEIDVTAVGGDVYFTDKGMQVTDQNGVEWITNINMSNDFDDTVYEDLDDLYGGDGEYDGSSTSTDQVYELKEGETGTVTIYGEIENVDDWTKLEIDSIDWWALDEEDGAHEFQFDKSMDAIDELETDEIMVRTSAS